MALSQELRARILSEQPIRTFERNLSHVPVSSVRSSYVPPKLDMQKKYQEQSKCASALTFPGDLPEYYFNINISKYSRNNTAYIGVLDKKRGIKLPIPMSLMDSQHVTYSEEEISKILSTAANLYNGGVKGSLDAAKNAVQTSIAGGSQSVTGAAGAAATVAGSSTASTFFGLASNQFLTVLFKGPSYKKYNLMWKLVPTNKRESEIIFEIIAIINNHMAPQLAYGQFIFAYPHIFSCSFSDGPKKFLNKMYSFKPSVLETFSVDYAGSGSPAFYKTGYPESVVLRMSFLELEFWLEGQFGQGARP